MATAVVLSSAPRLSAAPGDTPAAASAKAAPAVPPASNRPRFSAEEYEREVKAYADREAHLPPADMTLVATMSSPVLKENTLIQLRDIAPRDPNLLPMIPFGRGPAWLGKTVNLYVMQPAPQRRLGGLNDLRGLVVIDDWQKALEFVRWRTCPDLRFLLDAGYPAEAEIITVSDYPDLPTCGIRAWKLWLPESDGAPDPDTYGDCGLLSASGFEKGGFEPPKVTDLPNGQGFAVVRWTFHQEAWPGKRFDPENPRNVVTKLRETVGRDGLYKREVLLQRDAPKLPYTKWRLFVVFM